MSFALPILPGKTEDFRKFAAELSGPRAKEYEEFEQRQKDDRETWFLQRSAQGDMIIVYFENDDPLRALSEVSASKRPFEIWFKESVKQITGVDLNEPNEEPLPEQVFKYRY